MPEDDFLSQLAALAEEARRNAQKAREEAERWDHRAAILDSQLQEAQEGLQFVPTLRIMGQMDLGRNEESRALKIAKTRSSGKKRDPAYQAILDAGLTPASAAALCGTTRDSLKQAWRKGRQLRPARPEWIKTLEKHGVPRSVWRTKN